MIYLSIFLYLCGYAATLLFYYETYQRIDKEDYFLAIAYPIMIWLLAIDRILYVREQKKYGNKY